MNKEAISVFRPVAERSIPSLSKLHGAREAFPRHDIQITSNPHATIIERYESLPSAGRPIDGRDRGIALNLHPLPNHSEHTPTLPVIDVQYLGKRMYHRVVALILADPEGIMTDEREEYLRRMQKTIGGKHFIPHVSVMSVDAGLATNDLLDWVSSRAPKTITLDKLTSRPEIPAPIPRIKNRPRSETTELPEIPELPPIRNITTAQKIPQALINSLRGNFDTQTP